MKELCYLYCEECGEQSETFVPLRKGPQLFTQHGNPSVYQFGQRHKKLRHTLHVYLWYPVERKEQEQVKELGEMCETLSEKIARRRNPEPEI